MSNDFNKEERVSFENILAGYQDAIVISKNVTVFNTDSTEMERANDMIWRPYPYIMTSYPGRDQSANFRDKVQLSVPSRLGYARCSPWKMNARELRDALQEDRLDKGARQRLASDINTSVMNVAALQGTIVIKRTSAASGFDDAAQIEASYNEQGIPFDSRYWAITTRDYNGMASNLASRQTMAGKPTTAYEQAYVGRIASFETYKMDTGFLLPAAAGGGGITISTLDGVNDYTPVATSTAATGESGNVDNRYQRVTVSSTTNVAAGDCFTIASVDVVHHITKQDTGQLKTFRVFSVDSATTMTISPPIISNQVQSDAATQYQNCTVLVKAANSAIVFLNTVKAGVNPFWFKDGIELMPGRYAVPTDAGSAVMRGSTDQGLELVMQKWYDIKTMETLYRIDALWGVTMTNPEMCGICLFNQT